MADAEAMAAAERVFEVLAMPYSEEQKLGARIAFLEYAPLAFYAEYPRECDAIVAAAFERGALWTEVVDAASIDLAEGQRRWKDVESPKAAFSLGNTLYDAGDARAAIEPYQRAIKSGDKKWAPLAGIRCGMALALEGDRVGAIATLQHVIGIGEPDEVAVARRTLYAITNN